MRSFFLVWPLLFGLSSCSLFGFGGDDPKGDRKDRNNGDDDDDNGDDDDDDDNNGDDDDNNGDDDDTTPTDPGTSTTRDDPRAPEILSFALDSERITEGEELILSVIVTDPDGAGDILAGELLTLGGASFGTFTATGQGSFEISVGWFELNEMESIDINGVPIFRELVARFYDTAGHSAQLTFSTELYCDEDGIGCDGSCAILGDYDPSNCGACGNVCPDGLCGEGSCAVISDCATVEGQSCDDVCNEQGLGSCVVAGFGYSYYLYLAAGLGSIDECTTLYINVPIDTCSDPMTLDLDYYNAVPSAACFCEG